MKKALKSIDLSLLSQLCFSVLTIVMGILIMSYKAFGLLDLVLYTSTLFYIYAFLSLIAYFVKRKEGDYEMLFLSLIHVIVATLLYVFKDSKMDVMLGAGILIYSILFTCNRLYKIYQLKNIDSYMWVVKTMSTILIAFLSIITSVNLYAEEIVQTMMLGYYFITLGIILTGESIIEVFITEDKFRKILRKVLANESKLDEVETPEVKEERPKRKPGRPKKID